MSHRASGESRLRTRDKGSHIPRFNSESSGLLLPLRQPSFKSGAGGGGGRDSAGRSGHPSSTTRLTELAPPSPPAAREAQTPRRVPSRSRRPGASPARPSRRRTEPRPRTGSAGTSKRDPPSLSTSSRCPVSRTRPTEHQRRPGWGVRKVGSRSKMQALRPPEPGRPAAGTLPPGRPGPHRPVSPRLGSCHTTLTLRKSSATHCRLLDLSPCSFCSFLGS